MLGKLSAAEAVELPYIDCAPLKVVPKRLGVIVEATIAVGSGVSCVDELR